MPWTPFTTQKAKFIAVQGFRMQALQHTRNHVPQLVRGTYDLAVKQVADLMDAGAVGCSGMVFDPDDNDVLDYIQRNLERTRKAGITPLPSAQTLANKPEAAQSARHALVALAFVDTAGQWTQAFP